MCTAPIAGAGTLAARMDALVAHSEEAASDGVLSEEEVKSLRAEAGSILGDTPVTQEAYGDRTMEDAASSAASLKSALAVARADGEVTANEIEAVKDLVDDLNKTLMALPSRHDTPPPPPAVPATPAPTDAQAAADSQKAAADSQKAAADSQLAAADAQKVAADAQKAAADAQVASAEAALVAANGHGRKGGHGHKPGDGHKVGSPGHHAAGDGHKIGSPGHHAAGDGHKIGSPGHPHTPGDGHKAGTPGHKKADVAHYAEVQKATADLQTAVDAQKVAADAQKAAVDAQKAAADAQTAAAGAQAAAVDAQKAAADAQKVSKVDPAVSDPDKDVAKAKGIAQGIATLVSDVSLALKDGVVSDEESAKLHKSADALDKLSGTERKGMGLAGDTGTVADAKAARDDLASTSSAAMKDGRFTADEIKSAMAKVGTLMNAVDKANQGTPSTDGDAAFFKKLSEVLAQFVGIGDKVVDKDKVADTPTKKPDDSGSLMKVEDGNYLFGLGTVVSAFERNSKQILG